MVPAALTHPQALRLIGDCWLAFLVVWLIGALNAKRTQEQWSRGTGLAYLIVSVATYFLLVGLGSHPRPVVIFPTPGCSLFAVGLGVAGVLVAVWARAVLGRNWSGSITYKEGHELIERGPYRFVRHPIYTGMLLMVVGTALVEGTPQALLAIVLFTVVHIWKLRLEEQLLLRHFPNTYPAYRSRTKALIPWVY